MANGTPIKLTLYENDEPKQTFSRSFVPWGILKAALKLQNLDQGNLSEEDVNKINGLVCEFFGNQFKPDDLEKGASLEEVFAVLTAITSRLQGDLPGLGGANPTLPKKE